MSSENSENATVLPPISSISSSLPLTSTIMNNQRILSANTLPSSTPAKQITSTNLSQSPEMQSNSTSLRKPLPSYSSSLSKLLNNDVHESDQFGHQPEVKMSSQETPQSQQQQQHVSYPEDKAKAELKPEASMPHFSNSVQNLVAEQKDDNIPTTHNSNGDKNCPFHFQQEQHRRKTSSEDSQPSPKSFSEKLIAHTDIEQIRQLTARNRQQMDVKFLSPSTIQSRNFPQNTANTDEEKITATRQVSDNTLVPDVEN
ncbi:unnamed protein product [[Candida] boidinii]|uniref:Unnamed protein product n=1 Tax=Candida boidinii TaxID=5477 RepID=A0A9W6SWX2_CANBO|nr:unnamed protein product [[Candida] boidinii]